MKKLLYYFLFGACMMNAQAQDHSGTGALFDDKTSQEALVTTLFSKGLLKVEGSMTRGSSNTSSFSLEKYLPEIGDQGDLGSCVGWATSYYGMTIVKKIEGESFNSPYSALSTYNRYCFKEKRDPCMGGAYFKECLDILKAKGCPKADEYELPYCAKDKRKKPYTQKLNDYHRIQQTNVEQIKSYLRGNCPVVVGMVVYAGGKGNSLNTKFLDTNGVIMINNFKNDYPAAGHALCIVGYDDELSGGAFKIVNSWGKDWGKNGFCWIRYNDLNILKCAYAMIPKSE